jgi:hypothetical protein
MSVHRDARFLVTNAVPSPAHAHRNRIWLNEATNNADDPEARGDVHCTVPQSVDNDETPDNVAQKGVQ